MRLHVCLISMFHEYTRLDNPMMSSRGLQNFWNPILECTFFKISLISDVCMVCAYICDLILISTIHMWFNSYFYGVICASK